MTILICKIIMGQGGNVIHYPKILYNILNMDK